MLSYSKKSKKNNHKIIHNIALKQIVKQGLLLCIIYVFISAIMSHAFLSETFYTVQINSEGKNSLRVVHLSDLHDAQFGNDNETLINLVSKNNPDLIFISGDLINRDTDNIVRAQSLVQNFARIAPVFYSIGNHERDYEKQNHVQIEQVFSGENVYVLDNQYTDIVVKGIFIRVGGVYGYCLSDRFIGTPNFNEVEHSFLKSFENTEKYKFLLSHLPYPWTEYGMGYDWKIDCVFSGNSHGGQIRIPFVGGLYDPELGWLPKRIGGLSECGTFVIVSRGLGSDEMIPRINNLPEVVIADLFL